MALESFPANAGAPWLAAAELPEELGRAWARAWPDWFGPARVPLPRAPHKGELALVATPLGPIVAKRERARGWKRSLARLRARSMRSVRCFRLGSALLEAGFATPAPLAVLGAPGEAVLVTRFVAGVGPWELLPRMTGPEPLLATLAEGLARLHGAGFRHRDLKASNLLFRDRGEGDRGDGTPELVWTDLEGLRHVGAVESRLRARDLARLETSFASAEARAAGVRAHHWRALIALYLERSLGRAPHPAEIDGLMARTRAWSERHIRRHLARGQAVR